MYAVASASGAGSATGASSAVEEWAGSAVGRAGPPSPDIGASTFTSSAAEDDIVPVVSIEVPGVGVGDKGVAGSTGGVRPPVGAASPALVSVGAFGRGIGFEAGCGLAAGLGPVLSAANILTLLPD